MRNSPLRAFVKKDPNESISDSVAGRTPNIREVKIVPKKSQKQKDFEAMQRSIKKEQEKGPGKIYDKTAEQLKQIQSRNPLATLFGGRKKTKKG